MNKKLQDKVDKAHVMAYIEKKNNTEIAKHFGVSNPTITKYLNQKKPSEKIQKMIDDIDKHEEEKIQDAVEQIKGKGVDDIVNIAMGLISDKETLVKEIENRGITPVVNMLDKLWDKRIKIIEMEKRHEIQEHANDTNDKLYEVLINKVDEINKSAIDLESHVDPNSIRHVQ